MDAPSLSPDRSRELAALRRRAYGPEADIDGDAAAQERLRELESLARPRPAETGGSAASDAEAVADEDDAQTETENEPGPEPEVTAVAEEPAVPTASRRPSRRLRVPVWAVALVAAGVGGALGFGLAGAMTPQPERVLRVTPLAGERGPSWESELQSWGLTAGTAVPYEEYDGVGVWVVRSDDGNSCILIERDGRPVTAGCAGSGLDPVLDVTTYEQMGQIFDSERAIGSTTRFIARDGGIEVWEGASQQSSDIDTSTRDSVPSEP